MRPPPPPPLHSPLRSIDPQSLPLVFECDAADMSVRFDHPDAANNAVNRDPARRATPGTMGSCYRSPASSDSIFRAVFFSLIFLSPAYGMILVFFRSTHVFVVFLLICEASNKPFLILRIIFMRCAALRQLGLPRSNF